MSLQNTAQSIALTQGRLASGLAVRGPTDDAVKYFQARSLSSRATDLTERKDAMDQGVSTLDATLKATGAMEKLVTQIKGVVNSARSQTGAERKEASTQIKELVSQMQKLVDDASYKGLNLLNSTGATLTVRFSEKGDSKLDVKGVDFRTSKFFLNSAGATLSCSVLSWSGGQQDAVRTGLQVWPTTSQLTRSGSHCGMLQHHGR